MSLARERLENVSDRADGAYTARCPACAAEGHDRSGEHLIVYPSAAYDCIKYSRDAAHRRAIYRLAGAAAGAPRTAARPWYPRPVVIVPWWERRNLRTARTGESNSFSSTCTQTLFPSEE